MSFKPRPEKIYRIEQRSETNPYSNHTTQYMKRPKWWPGPSVATRVSYRGSEPHEVTITYMEGTVDWGDS